MKLYISWSRTLGYFAAKEMVYAISRVFNETVAPYFSALSLERGKDWFFTNQQALHGADHAIILVSRRGMTSPWLLYEAGTLLNQAQTKCDVLLLDLIIQDLSGNPLSHFHCIDCHSSQFEDLFSRIADSRKSEANLIYEPVGSVVSSTRSRLLLLSRAEQLIVDYLEPTTAAQRKALDPNIYNACSALLEAGISEEEISAWLQIDGIPLAEYSNHLFNLRSPPDASDKTPH